MEQNLHSEKVPLVLAVGEQLLLWSMSRSLVVLNPQLTGLPRPVLWPQLGNVLLLLERAHYQIQRWSSVQTRRGELQSHAPKIEKTYRAKLWDPDHHPILGRPQESAATLNFSLVSCHSGLGMRSPLPNDTKSELGVNLDDHLRLDSGGHRQVETSDSAARVPARERLILSVLCPL